MEVLEAYWDVYTDMWAFGWFCGLMFSCCLWCCLAHCILQPCCTCLKKRSKFDHSVFKSGKKEPWNVIGGHRGGSIERLESTLAAFQNAVATGCNLLELDVYATKDGVIIVSHDRGLGRLCGDAYSNTNIDETNFADLPPLQNTVRQGEESTPYTQGANDDGKWLKLQDLFAAMPSNVFYTIDLKCWTTKDADLVYNHVKSYSLQTRVVWGSGYEDIHSHLMTLDSQIATYYPEGDLIRMHALHLFGCLFCYPLKNDFLLTPIMTDEQVEREKYKRDRDGNGCLNYNQIVNAVKLFQCLGYAMYAQLRRRGNSVVMWTPNTKSEFDWLWKVYGDTIDGVMTDSPTKLQEWRQKKGQSLMSVIQLGKDADQEGEELTVFVI